MLSFSNNFTPTKYFSLVSNIKLDCCDSFRRFAAAPPAREDDDVCFNCLLFEFGGGVLAVLLFEGVVAGTTDPLVREAVVGGGGTIVDR
jgi:hypothetical protein